MMLKMLKMLYRRRCHVAKETKQSSSHFRVTTTTTPSTSTPIPCYNYQSVLTSPFYYFKRLSLFVLLFVVVVWYYYDIKYYYSNSNNNSRFGWTVSRKNPTTTTSTASRISKKEQDVVIPQLPEQLFIGYVDKLEEEEKIIQAVKDGVNVLIWAFFNFNETTGEIEYSSSQMSHVESLIQNKLSSTTETELIHLTSFGGWNGPHLPTSSSSSSSSSQHYYYSSKELYDSWVRFNYQHNQLFHGFDWDLEGHDNPTSKTSNLTLDCIQYMIQITKYAKNDGYIVGMAPPQSYLDIQSDHTTTNNNNNGGGGPFSTQLNLPPLLSSLWHPEFHYTGYNSYAPLLLFSDIDFISIQFYETWSRANYEINHRTDNKKKVDPSTYLIQYVEDLVYNRNQGYHVLFSSKHLAHFTNNNKEEEEELVRKFIPVPINKLVFGFANGWALNRKDGGVLYVDPMDVQKAFETFKKKKSAILPRGCMFWSIGWEGENGIHFAKELHQKLWNNNNNKT